MKKLVLILFVIFASVRICFCQDERRMGVTFDEDFLHATFDYGFISETKPTYGVARIVDGTSEKADYYVSIVQRGAIHQISVTVVDSKRPDIGQWRFTDVKGAESFTVCFVKDNESHDFRIMFTNPDKAKQFVDPKLFNVVKPSIKRL